MASVNTKNQLRRDSRGRFATKKNLKKLVAPLARPPKLPPLPNFDYERSFRDNSIKVNKPKVERPIPRPDIPKEEVRPIEKVYPNTTYYVSGIMPISGVRFRPMFMTGRVPEGY